MTEAGGEMTGPTREERVEGLDNWVRLRSPKNKNEEHSLSQDAAWCNCRESYHRAITCQQLAWPNCLFVCGYACVCGYSCGCARACACVCVCVRVRVRVHVGVGVGVCACM